MSWDVAKRYPLSILLSVSFVQENIQENIFSSNCFLILGDQIKNLRKKNEHRAMKWESRYVVIQFSPLILKF